MALCMASADAPPMTDEVRAEAKFGPSFPLLPPLMVTFALVLIANLWSSSYGFSFSARSGESKRKIASPMRDLRPGGLSG